MGKIRIKALGSEELEREERNKAKIKKEQKKLVKIGNLKGGQRIASVEPTEEELAKTSVQTPETKEKKSGKKTSSKKAKNVRSKKYTVAAKLVDKTKTYSVAEALKLLGEIKLSKFDETVELHINTTETGISGSVSLPNGSGKTIRIKIASPSKDPKGFEELLKILEKGNFDFDMLVATPDAMSTLAKYARFLGPKGLMPNPKNGTVTNEPQKVVERFGKGEITFKTESKFPIIHLRVGKMSFGQKKLLQNIESVTKALPIGKIKKAVLKSTMSPGIKISL